MFLLFVQGGLFGAKTGGFGTPATTSTGFGFGATQSGGLFGAKTTTASSFGFGTNTSTTGFGGKTELWNLVLTLGYMKLMITFSRTARITFFNAYQ